MVSLNGVDDPRWKSGLNGRSCHHGPSKAVLLGPWSDSTVGSAGRVRIQIWYNCVACHKPTYKILYNWGPSCISKRLNKNLQRCIPKEVRVSYRFFLLCKAPISATGWERWMRILPRRNNQGLWYNQLSLRIVFQVFGATPIVNSTQVIPPRLFPGAPAMHL